jgi:hypothetical protein
MPRRELGPRRRLDCAVRLDVCNSSQPILLALVKRVEINNGFNARICTVIDNIPCVFPCPSSTSKRHPECIRYNPRAQIQNAINTLVDVANRSMIGALLAVVQTFAQNPDFSILHLVANLGYLDFGRLDLHDVSGLLPTRLLDKRPNVPTTSHPSPQAKSRLPWPSWLSDLAAMDFA